MAVDGDFDVALDRKAVRRRFGDAFFLFERLRGRR